MIRQGRDVVDRAGIAELHHVRFTWARDHAIWNRPGHPAPVGGGTRRPGGQARHRLWDREQAAAFAEGRRPPRLPTKNAAGDLLDVDDVAALRGVEAATVAKQVRDGYLPAPDTTLYDVWHWRRETLDRIASQPSRQGARTDREPGQPSGSAQERVHAALERDPEADLAEIMRHAHVSRPTAVRWRKDWQENRVPSKND